MSVYVDPLVSCVPTRRWHHNRSCHLFADTLEDLYDFAICLGLEPSWLQWPRYPAGDGLPHFDLTENKRREAVLKGAIELTREQAIDKWADLGWAPHKQMRDKRAAKAAKEQNNG